MDVITVDKLLKKYDDQIVLNSISLQIKKNCIVGILGNNGSGKTTLIKSICNLIDYENGVIKYCGDVINGYNKTFKKHLGIILSEHYFIESFTVSEFLQFVAKFQLIPKLERIRRIEKVQDYFDLKHYKKAKIKNLSSGTRSRLAIATAMVHDPETLIFDEPFVNLDVSSSESLRKYIENITKDKTIIITSHNLNLIVDLCSRFIVLENGSISLDIYKSDYAEDHQIVMAIKDRLIRNSNNKTNK